MQIRWIALPIFVMAALVLACGGDKQTTSTPLPTQTVAGVGERPITAGWQRLTGGDAKIDVPLAFVHGDRDINNIVERLKELAPEFAQQAEAIRSHPEYYPIFAIDESRQDETGFPTTLNVAVQPAGGLSAEVVLDGITDALRSQGSTLIDRRSLKLNGVPFIRAEFEGEFAFATARQVAYVTSISDRLWTIVFATSSTERDERFPVFEQAAQSFRVGD